MEGSAAAPEVRGGGAELPETPSGSDKRLKTVEDALLDEQAKRRWAKLRVASILAGKVLAVAQDTSVVVLKSIGRNTDTDTSTYDGSAATSRETDASAGVGDGAKDPTQSGAVAGGDDGAGEGAYAEGGRGAEGGGSSHRGLPPEDGRGAQLPGMMGGEGGGAPSWLSELKSRSREEELKKRSREEELKKRSDAEALLVGEDPPPQRQLHKGNESPSFKGKVASGGGGRATDAGAADENDPTVLTRVNTIKRVMMRVSATITMPKFSTWRAARDDPSQDNLQSVINRAFANDKAVKAMRERDIRGGASAATTPRGRNSVAANDTFAASAADQEAHAAMNASPCALWWRRCRPRIWRFTSDPDSSLGAKVLSVVILFLIVFSTATFCLETMEDLQTPGWKDAFWYSEVLCVAIFTLEYLTKLASAPQRWVFVKNALNVVDLMAVLPFYIEMLAAAGTGLGDTRIVRVIRLVRVFRVLKLGGRVGKLQVVGNAVADSADMLAMLGFLLLLAVILFSSLVYYAEKGSTEKEDDQFSSIPASFWWCMVTLMTVGYGDTVPTTEVGQLVASATMIASVIILALPISVIGTNFTQQWMEYKNATKMRERSQQMIPRLHALMVRTRLHMDVVEELLNATREVENFTEKKTSLMKADIRSNGLVIKTVQPGGGGFEVITAMASQKKLWGSMHRVKDGVTHLEELLAYMDLVSHSSFVASLEKAQNKYTRLDTIKRDGQNICKEVDELESEVEDLRMHFSNPYLS